MVKLWDFEYLGARWMLLDSACKMSRRIGVKADYCVYIYPGHDMTPMSLVQADFEILSLPLMFCEIGGIKSPSRELHHFDFNGMFTTPRPKQHATTTQTVCDELCRRFRFNPNHENLADSHRVPIFHIPPSPVIQPISSQSLQSNQDSGNNLSTDKMYSNVPPATQCQ